MPSYRPRFVLALFLGTTLFSAGLTQAEEISAGAYLAGRYASAERDFAATDRYLSQVLENNPENLGLLEGLVIARLGQGQLEAPLAQRLRDLGGRSNVADLVVLTDQAQRKDWRGLQMSMESGLSYVPLANELASAWALAGLGRMDEALAAFDEVSTQRGMKSEALYHKALALAMVGDHEGAAGLFALPADEGIMPNRRTIRTQVEVLSQLGRNDEATALLETTRALGPGQGFDGLRLALAEGRTLPPSLVSQPSDGLAEALLSVAAILNIQNNRQVALVYARAAQALKPEDADINLLTASLLEDVGRPDLAIEVFGQIPADDPQFVAAELGRAGALDAQGERPAAIEVLRALERVAPDEGMIPASLGDLLRGQEDMVAAEAAYERALGATAPDAANRWILLYAQGITRERQGNWDGAERNFRAALELQPDQPAVLNYLGYSLVERREKLDEALSMIRAAVAVEPENGAIVDSLGWALYRLGQVEEAVGHLERAAVLEPVDPTINDHLGDALWIVGRRNEARFHWNRALSFDPEEEVADMIRTKLELQYDAPLPDAPEAALGAERGTGGDDGGQ